MIGRGIVTVLALAAGLTASAMAQQARDDDAIDVSADERLEWRQEEKLYLAVGNAQARQKDITLNADRLVAHYRDTPGGDTEIWRIELHGNARVERNDGIIYGDAGVFEEESGIFVMTGRDLRYIEGSRTLTAKDTLEFWREENMAVARGKVHLIDGDRDIRANVLTATYGEEGTEDEGELVRVDAFEGVRVETENDITFSDKLVYDPESDIAVLTGNVRITSDDRQVNGERAEIDFAANVSRIVGRGKSRVQGLFSSD